MAVDLIIYAVIAAGLVLWLRSVLGTRHGDERERANPFTPPADETAVKEVLAEIIQDRVSGFSDEAHAALAKIRSMQSGFDLAKFASNARDAFTMIVTAFSTGDRDTLKMLLTPSMYQSFDQALREREKTGETLETEIHNVKKVEVVDAALDGHTASLTLKISASETIVHRDSAGRVIEGDENHVIDMVDLWTFSRDMKSKDPTWYLSATADGEREIHGQTVPYTA
ncbi:MAG: Tim44/TimA family putative adaptor protein [Alphaproteobacteria bacterium]|nr:Tim44/TimA family putative adaptor protein [Alphaproteobacteria bacterium]